MNLLRKLGARTAAGALGMLLAAAWVGNTAQAQTQQAASKPISVIVPFSAGSASDSCSIR
jgi:tripartite-type tricarboxylate transporter receptor subunit TctC